MAARQPTLTTESVLQLLLDENSENESDDDSFSEYRRFVGRILTDSEDEIDDEEHERSKENREISTEGENIVEEEPEEQSGDLSPPMSHSTNVVQDY